MNFAGKKVFAVLTAAVMVGAMSTVGTFAADNMRSYAVIQESAATYHMTVPVSGVGYTASATGNDISVGKSFEFRVALKQGFQKRAPIVCANNVQISPLEMDSSAHTYTYVIPEVKSNAVFTVSALADSAETRSNSIENSQPQQENPSGFPLHYNGVTCSDLTGVQPLSCGGLLTFKVYSKTVPQVVRCGNGKIGSVNAAIQSWNAKTQTSVWQVYGVASSGRTSDDAGIYAELDGNFTKLFSVKLTSAPYSCDTTVDISTKPGKQYWAKVTTAKGAKVSFTAGDGMIVSTLVKNNGKPANLGNGKDTYYVGLKATKCGRTGLYLTVDGKKYCMFRVTVA